MNTSQAKYITAGAASKQRAEDYAYRNGGRVVELFRVWRQMDVDLSEPLGPGHAVVGRYTKYDIVKCRDLYGEIE